MAIRLAVPALSLGLLGCLGSPPAATDAGISDVSDGGDGAVGGQRAVRDQIYLGQSSVFVALDGTDRPRLAGSFTGTIALGNASLTAEPSSGLQVYLASLADEATSLAAYGGTGDEHVHGLAVDPVSGEMTLSGRYSGEANLGPETFPSPDVDTAHTFVARYNSRGDDIWALRGTSSGGTVPAQGLSVDGSSSVIVGGDCRGTVTFSPEARGGFGGDDAYLAGIDVDGTVTSLARWGSGGDERIRAAVHDGLGSIYLIGSYTGSWVFAEEALTGGDGTTSLFIAQAGPSGSPVSWTLHTTATARIDDVAAATTAAGDVIVVGSFEGTLAIEPGITEPVESDGLDIFVAFIDREGTGGWLINLGQAGSDAALAVAVDDEASIHVAGYYTGEAIFGPYSLTSSGGSDGFYAYLSDTGEVIEAHSLGGEADDRLLSVAIANDGNAYLGLSFRGLVDLGLGEPLQSSTTEPHGALVRVGN